MKFINRIQEMHRLDHLASHTKEGVVVVWGRRRVGKTRLLLEWAQKHNGVYFTADESAAPVQRKYFALALEKILPGFSDVEYPDWSTLLKRLTHDAMTVGWRGPIIIDELPYLISESPEFPSILQKFIDHDAKQAKFIIALCGSSQRMMQGAVLDASAPLYGRANELIKLYPISIGYIGEALGIKNSRQIIENYSVWGGIPRYWELVANNKEAFLETIDNLVLDPMGPLNDEPHRLLLEEDPPAVSLRPILDAIGLGANRLSEIAAKIGQPVTSLGRPMLRLTELDLVEREVPFGAEEQSSKRALYKIKDPFVRFWFDIVAPRRSFFAQASPTTRRQILRDALPPLFSTTWEDISRRALPHLSEELESIFGQASRYWHGKGHEWDIVAESVNKKSLFIGEAKWIEKVPSESWILKTIDNLKSKGFPPIKRNPHAKIIYGLFIPEKPKKINLPQNVKIWDAEDVLKVLRF